MRHMCISLCMVCVRAQHVCHCTVGLVCMCVSMLSVCLCPACVYAQRNSKRCVVRVTCVSAVHAALRISRT